MFSTPTTRLRDVLVVFDGPRRIIWQRRGRAGFIPRGVWPDAGDRAQLLRHLAEGKPLLVVVQEPVTRVPLLAEQLAGAPADLLARTAGNGEIADVEIPALDWLDADLRGRGLDFLDASAAAAATVPPSLRAPIVLEDVPRDSRGVRFAHRLAPAPHVDRDLASIVRYAFPERLRAAA